MSKQFLFLTTAYMPPIAWLAAAVQHKNVYMDFMETYQKQSFRNRCFILTSQGVLPLSIPVVQTSGKHSPLKEIRICKQTPWQRQHFRAICSAYQKSPFFLYYRDELEKFYTSEFEYLWEYNGALIEFFLKKFRLNIDFKEGKPEDICGIQNPETGSDNPEFTDLRRCLHPKMPSPVFVPDYIHTFPFENTMLHEKTRFSGKNGEVQNLSNPSMLSVLDLLCNMGNESDKFFSKAIV